MFDHIIEVSSEKELGFVFLRELVRQQPDQAISRIKKWIHERSCSQEFLVLISIPQMLESEEISKLLAHLSLSERKEWKVLLDQRPEGPTGEELNRANEFLMNEKDRSQQMQSEQLKSA